MWVRKVVAILLVGLFVFSTFGLANAVNRPPLNRFSNNPQPTGPGPDEDPWEDVDHRGDDNFKADLTGNSFDVIFISNIPMVMEMEVENALLNAKRGK